MLNFLHFTAREYCPLNNKEQDLWCSVELFPILQHPSKGNGTRRLHFYTPPPRVLENSTTPAEDVIIFKDLLPYPKANLSMIFIATLSPVRRGRPSSTFAKPPKIQNKNASS